MDSTITPAVNGEKPTAGAEKKPTKRPKRRPVSGNGTRQKRKAAADGGNGKPKNKGNRPSIKPASRKKIGRPSKYNPAFCERVIELGAEGKSKAQISAAIGVSRDTLREWGGIYPDFSAALKRAKELELAWWETVGQACMLRPGFNATAFILQMKNRFREDYRDVSHGEHRITQFDRCQRAGGSAGHRLHDGQARGPGRV